MTVNLVDVSQYQDTDHSLVGVSGVIARASIGTRWDLAYDLHINEALRAKAADGLPLTTGAYHFNERSLSVADQVKVFRASAARAPAGLKALDVEGDGSTAFTLAQAKEFIDRMHQAGDECGLYHSLSGYMEAGQDWDWVAFWSGTPPQRNWTLWQYGRAPSGVDGDRFIGTLAQLRALAVTLPDSSTTGGDVKFVNSNGYAVDSGKRIHAVKGDKWLYLDGSAAGEFSGDADLVVLGLADAHSNQYVVKIGTGLPYPNDTIVRDTLALFQTTRALTDPAPSPVVVPDCTAVVEAARVEAASAATTTTKDTDKLAVAAAAEILRTAGLLA